MLMLIVCMKRVATATQQLEMQFHLTRAHSGMASLQHLSLLSFACTTFHVACAVPFAMLTKLLVAAEGDEKVCCANFQGLICHQQSRALAETLT